MLSKNMGAVEGIDIDIGVGPNADPDPTSIR
jgi:hypothetical protein